MSSEIKDGYVPESCYYWKDFVLDVKNQTLLVKSKDVMMKFLTFKLDKVLMVISSNQYIRKMSEDNLLYSTSEITSDMNISWKYKIISNSFDFNPENQRMFFMDLKTFILECKYLKKYKDLSFDLIHKI